MLVLIRHPVVAFAAGLCYGRLDVPIKCSADVTPMVARLGNLAPFEVWASPAVRCRAVADAISDRFGVPARFDLRLLELDFGDWEGRPWSEIPIADLDRWAVDPGGFAPPGGESGEALTARVRDFYRTACRAERLVVVTHGGPLRVLRALAHGNSIDLLVMSPPPGAVDVIERHAVVP